ncbi:MAG: nitroreductase family protein [Bacteroidaceae bacterium]|nr:nitroreductase family protein [Bacteroidaceae bacterium]
MNRYKIVCLVLSVALLASLARLAVTANGEKACCGKHSAEAKSSVVLQNILNRKSVRSFTDRPVSREQLDTLLRAAMAAPTGRDMRPWKFVVVQGRAEMDSLAQRLPYAKMLTEAAAAIIVCGDLSVLSKEGKPSTNWTFDCSAATENLLLMAEAMGLGAVWTGVHPYEDRLSVVKAALGLPEHIVPLNVVPIGYPKGTPQPKDKFDAANIHNNRW